MNQLSRNNLLQLYRLIQTGIDRDILGLTAWPVEMNVSLLENDKFEMCNLKCVNPSNETASLEVFNARRELSPPTYVRCKSFF